MSTNKVLSLTIILTTFISCLFNTSPPASPSFARSVCQFLDVTSLTHVKEVTKKTCQSV